MAKRYPTLDPAPLQARLDGLATAERAAFIGRLHEHTARWLDPWLATLARAQGGLDLVALKAVRSHPLASADVICGEKKATADAGSVRTQRLAELCP